MEIQTCTFAKSSLPLPFVLIRWFDQKNMSLKSTIAKQVDDKYVDCMEIERDKESIMLKEFWESEYPKEAFGDLLHLEKPKSPKNSSLEELCKYFNIKL